MGLMMGTFVFTTGSFWKESLGFAFFTFLIFAFSARQQLRFRVLLFALLIIIPLVHHLVAAVALTLMAYLLMWSWLLALLNRTVGRRHFHDLLTVCVPIGATVFYYSSVSLDRLSMVGTPIKGMLLVSIFALISLSCLWVLLPRSHSRMSFAPVIGVSLVLLLLLDYFGYLFPYEPSAGHVYIVLVVAMGAIVSVGWYGSEIILEAKPVYKAIQLGLLVAPLTVVGFGMAGGFSAASHQVAYRVFDSFDVFIFIGAGAAIAFLEERSTRKQTLVFAVLFVSVVATFPFAYSSEALLGVRHDTQGYEVDALDWISERAVNPHVVTDERLSYIAHAAEWLTKDAALPQYLIRNVSLPSSLFCLVEDSWSYAGVNDYPNGRVVVPPQNLGYALQVSDVLYIGGPTENRVILYSPVEWSMVP